MKKTIIQTILLSICTSVILGSCQSFHGNKSTNDEISVNLMTYNIRNGVGIDVVQDIDRIINVINTQHPDILALQELDSVTTRSKGTYTLGILAEHTNMYATYAPAIHFQGGKYGVGMLSKEKPLNYHYYPLPGREEERTFLVVEFENFIYCCTHLSLTPEDQVLSLPIINKITSELKKPVIIAGDMNAHPTSKYIVGLQETFKIISPTDVKTYPADEPTETIDYIAVHHKDTLKVKAQSSQVLNEPTASDHRPIIATITIKK